MLSVSQRRRLSAEQICHVPFACVCDEAKGGLDNSPYKLLLIPTCFILTAMSGLNSDESDLTALSVG